MEQATFKSVTFGGFDKEDVVQYIQKMATEATQSQQQLSQQLQTMEAELQAKDADLQAKEAELAEKEAQWIEEEASLRQELQGQIDVLTPDAQAYQRFCQNMAALELEARARADAMEAEVVAKMETAQTEQTEKLQAMEAQTLQRLAEQEAQSDAKLSEQEAKSRALVDETRVVLQREVGQIAKHYNQMAADFANNAMAISAQLRSMDVSVLHMPQSLDQVGHQLKNLESALQDAGDNCAQDETE